MLIVLVGVAGSIWIQTHPRQMPLQKCSELYREYHKKKGIQASYIDAFPIDDTLTVAVTVLHATDSDAWNQLTTYFNISISPEAEKYAARGDPVVSSFLCPKGKYSQPLDTVDLANNDYIVSTMHNQTVCVFHLEHENQIDAILLYKIKEHFKRN